MNLRGRGARAGLCAGMAAITVGSLLAGCSNDSHSGMVGILDGYAAALSANNVSQAANLTTSPAQAGDALGSTIRGVSARKISVAVGRPAEYSDGSGTFTLTTTWDLGAAPHAAPNAPHRTFVTATQGSARKLSVGWRIQWDPTLIQAQMPAGGSLRTIRVDASPASRVVDDNKKPWMTLTPITDVVINSAAAADPASTARRLAASLEPVTPAITAAKITQNIAGSRGKPFTVVSLRDPDLRATAGDIATINGVSLVKGAKLLVTDRRVNTPLAAGIADEWQTIRDATSGWQAQVLRPGARPAAIAGEPGIPAPDLRTSFDVNTQLALADSVVDVAQPAAMMVLDAASGGIQAAAVNDAANAQNIRLTTPYPVGTALNPVFSAVDAAANSDDKKSSSIADTLGFGLSYDIPGLRATASNVAGTHAANGIMPVSFSQTDPATSMVQMAALGLAVAQEKSVPPWVIGGARTVVSNGSNGAVDPAVSAKIISAMKATAATGDASDLTRAPGLRALVGTNGPQGPGWFVGLQGGKVIVIYCTGEKSGTAALQVAQRYFTVK